MLVSKCVSIHSEDRDCIKYPSSSEFEIELPEDYLSVQTVKLSTWTFPANYNVFSALQANIELSFQLVDLYNPNEDETLTQLIYNIFCIYFIVVVLYQVLYFVG